MAASNLALERLQSGAPDLLSAWLNRKFAARGIRARVVKRDRHLLLAFESDPPPEARTVRRILEAIANRLDPNAVESLKVCGRSPGAGVPAWKFTLTVAPSRQSSAPVADFASWLESVKVPSALAPRRAERPSTGERFLRFHLGGSETALLPVAYIREVSSASGAEILPVPHVNAVVLGLYNWRGEMLWTIDLNLLLGFPSLWEVRHSADPIKIATLQVGDRLLGLGIEEVENIETHDWQQLQPPGGLFATSLLAYVEGYLADARSIILSAPAIARSPLLTQTEFSPL